MSKGKVTIDIKKTEYELIDGATGNSIASGANLKTILAKGLGKSKLGGLGKNISEEATGSELGEIENTKDLYVKCASEGCKQVANIDIGICEDCLNKINEKA